MLALAALIEANHSRVTTIAIMGEKSGDRFRLSRNVISLFLWQVSHSVTRINNGGPYFVYVIFYEGNGVVTNDIGLHLDPLRSPLSRFYIDYDVVACCCCCGDWFFGLATKLIFYKNVFSNQLLNQLLNLVGGDIF